MLSGKDNLTTSQHRAGPLPFLLQCSPSKLIAGFETVLILFQHGDKYRQVRTLHYLQQKEWPFVQTVQKCQLLLDKMPKGRLAHPQATMQNLFQL